MSMVKDGYGLPFFSITPPFYAKNNLSSLRYTTFVEESISDLLAKARILETEKPPYCVNPLTVSDKTAKYRLVLDLRPLGNQVQIRESEDSG